MTSRLWTLEPWPTPICNFAPLSPFDSNYNYSNTMKYNIRKASATTARLAIQSSLTIDPSRKPEIRRYYPGKNNLPAISRGAVLGRKTGHACALIVDVRPRDLIGIRENHLGTEDCTWLYFRVDADYRPVALNLPNCSISQEECAQLLKITETLELDQVDFTDDTLQRFLNQKHPGWLQEVVDRQIAHWREQKPEKFYRLAPMALAARDIAGCVRASPLAALARFKDQLNEAQLARCLIKSPKGAVMFAMEKIPPSKREKYFLDHAHEAMKFASHILTDKELNYCASIHMFSAFELRTTMSPERRAILLANSYMVSFFADFGNSHEALLSEIRRSLVEFPRQWCESDRGGLPAILEGLKTFANFPHDPALISELLEKAEPKDRKVLVDYLVSKI